MEQDGIVCNCGKKGCLETIASATGIVNLAIKELANGEDIGKLKEDYVSNAGDTLLKPLKEQFAQFAFPRVAEGVELVIAKLGNDAGVIGGAWLVKEALMNTSEQGKFSYCLGVHLLVS